jgi:hypothetical protein
LGAPEKMPPPKGVSDQHAEQEMGGRASSWMNRTGGFEGRRVRERMEEGVV